jgi:hypothetical protein
METPQLSAQESTKQRTELISSVLNSIDSQSLATELIRAIE